MLGGNGVGKTTTISSLIGVSDRTSGDISVQGGEVQPEHIGVVFQQSFFDPLLTAKENLEIRALLYNPEILVLDEHTAGLDPRSRRKVWEAINTLRTKDGCIVFLTTH
nr:ATP-binding cassette domain-containing protein [Corynebacterium deserti]